MDPEDDEDWEAEHKPQWKKELQGGVATVETLRECYTQLDRPQLVLLDTFAWVISSKASCKLHQVAFTKIDHWKTMENHGKPSTYNGRRPYRRDRRPFSWGQLDPGCVPSSFFWLMSCLEVFEVAVRHPKGAVKLIEVQKRPFQAHFVLLFKASVHSKSPKKGAPRATKRCHKSWPMSSNSSLAGNIFFLVRWFSQL